MLKRLLLAGVFGALGVVTFDWINARLAPVRNAILEPLYEQLNGAIISESILIGAVDSLFLMIILAGVIFVLTFRRRAALACCRKAALCLPLLMAGLISSTLCFGIFESAIAVPLRAATFFLTAGISSYAFLGSARRIETRIG